MKESPEDETLIVAEGLHEIKTKSGESAVPTEEKSDDKTIALNITTEDEKDQQQQATNVVSEDKTKIPYKLNENIYNAFLVLNYRPDLNLNDMNIHNYAGNLKIGLGIISYIIFVAQWSALILLIRIIMISSGTSYKDWGKESNYYSYFLFPFLIFGVVTTANELVQTGYDLRILKEWNMAIDSGKQGTKFHVMTLKMYGEQCLGFLGGLAYFAILTIYSKTDNWEDTLNVILNLLAYQFILDADEWAYQYFAKGRIAIYLARASSDGAVKDIFDGYFTLDQKPSFIESNRIYMNVAAIFGLCLLFQALLSDNKFLLIISCIIGGIMMIGGWITAVLEKCKSKGNKNQ